MLYYFCLTVIHFSSAFFYRNGCPSSCLICSYSVTFSVYSRTFQLINKRKESLSWNVNPSNIIRINPIRLHILLTKIFSSLPPDEQERLLIFIQGAKGLKITYDAFFKYVMNPEVHPSRLEEFLSAVLNQKITIHAVLPIEGTRMAEKGSFVIMDIIVELSDGSIVNIEIQKIGYLFPGERASCYISDFIMRQYNRVRDKPGKIFLSIILNPSFSLFSWKKALLHSKLYIQSICTAKKYPMTAT